MTPGGTVPASRRSQILLTVSGVAALSVGVALPGYASTPATSTVAVPSKAGVTATGTPWTGTIAPAADALSDCSAIPGNATSDPHTLKITVPSGVYSTINAAVTISITWTPSNPGGDETESDEVLTVLDPQGNEIGSSDGGSTTESLSFNNPVAGDYTVLACGFGNAAPQDYPGRVSISTTQVGVAPPLSSNQGLRFSASVPADAQRNEGEPAVVTARDGRVYTCGPNGFSNVADYAQVSTDHGDQFHLLGTAPRGQISTPPQGGGDCALATAPLKASGDKAFPLAYSGLGPLTGFSTFSSTDGGGTAGGDPDSQSVPGVDRQWITFTNARTAFLIYNSTLLPGGQAVQKSTDGGLTYTPVGQSAATDGSRLGQIHSILRNSSGQVVSDPAKSDPSKAIVYFPYSTASSVKLAMSHDGGDTWSQCKAVDTGVSPDAGFVAADNDDAGNIYVVYTEKGAGRDTYLVALPAYDVTKCKGSSTDSSKNNTNPGFGRKVRMNRGGVETTVMPWVTAAGAPGRVAVAYYGTRSIGDPNSGGFKATWDVYVDQVLSAFGANGAPLASPAVGQVKADTHPFHYDSICLDGLACQTTENGDRSLADYFTIDYNRKDGRLYIVYDQSYKKPGDAVGPWATPAVVSQIAGPSNGGGTVHVTGRDPLRAASPDPSGDAIANYSQLKPLGVVPTSPQPSTEVPAMDLVGSPAVRVGPEIDPGTGKPISGGGFTVRMTYKDLSSGALQSALQATASTDLLYLFRFVDGFQEAGASAHYDPVQGWRFGFDDFTTTTTNPGGDVLIWPGATSIKGKVTGNTIVLSVPRSVLHKLSGPTGPGQRPQEVKATVGGRFYDATAFTLAGPVPDVASQGSYMQQVDNAPAFDFLLPAAAVPPGGGGSGAGGGSGSASGSGSGGGSASGTGTLADTGGLGAPLAAFGSVLLGLALWRRVRRSTVS